MSRSRGVWSGLTGPNEAYLLELYEQFRHAPHSVDPDARTFFLAAGPPPQRSAGAALDSPTRGVPESPAHLIAAVSDLATAIREYGHNAAHLDPLGSDAPGDPELDPATHGLTAGVLAELPAAAVKGPAAAGKRSATEAIDDLRRIYCGTTAHDYDQVQDAEERVWLREAAETERFRPPHDEINPHALLERLTEVGAFERFLNRTFPGQTRFSIEGTGMLIPMLDEIIGAAAEAGIRAVLIGMAHRGRLNVLAHVLGKPHVEVLQEFKHPAPRAGISSSGETGGEFSGDVKYHLGHRRAVPTGEEVSMQVTLAPNPSHLEFVNPVVEGMSRAAGETRDAPGAASLDVGITLPVLIHGDAAFPGQGVVAETLNLSRLPGYTAGGTIHLIVNNQLGFTVEPSNARSTMYASDLAKGFEIPVVHVNADDPEACIAAVRLAHAYREQFHKDFLVDLIGYRRWGHNEGDDPSMTQPLMYAKIAAHPTVREIWAAEMVRRELVTKERVDELLAERTAELQRAMSEVNDRTRVEAPSDGPTNGAVPPPNPSSTGSGPPMESETGLAAAALRALHDALYLVPDGFTIHPRVDRLTLGPRRAAFDEQGEGGTGKPHGGETEDAGMRGRRAAIDWGHAETLAFASILADAIPIRLTGQDAQRGTFGQRHAVLHDAKTGATYVPLRHHPLARAAFEIWDSPLSENAAIGFEFGYSVQAPETLVVWEAQYGDFVNGAQVIVDQFIVSARTKWGQDPSLVLLLPHGYEGQGPEHSSARLERFLEQAAEGNIRVANCTTAAQYFHLLRRQARLLRDLPRPLIVMTPKSLLRHPLAASPLADFAEGTAFRPVLDDPLFVAGRDRGAVERVILCSGKVYVDLATSEARQTGEGDAANPRTADRVAIVRVEQLYRFPAESLERILANYPAARDVVWLQEEPQNMGAWTFVAPRLQQLLDSRAVRVRFIGRPERASPSEGTPAWHAAEQSRIIAEAFDGLTDAAGVTVMAAKGKSNG